MSFEREIEFLPAYDRRDPNPSKNYGIHGVELHFRLKGERGVVQLVVYTMWNLPHVAEELVGGRYGNKAHASVLCQPMPADLGYHSPKPPSWVEDPSEVEYMHRTDCPFLPDGECWYDGSALNAEPMFETLLRGGSDALWAGLESYYRETFEESS